MDSHRERIPRSRAPFRAPHNQPSGRSDATDNERQQQRANRATRDAALGSTDRRRGARSRHNRQDEQEADDPTAAFQQLTLGPNPMQPFNQSINTATSMDIYGLAYEPSRYRPPEGLFFTSDQVDGYHVGADTRRWKNCIRCGQPMHGFWKECIGPCVFCRKDHHKNDACPLLYVPKEWFKVHLGFYKVPDRNQIMPDPDEMIKLIEHGYGHWESNGEFTYVPKGKEEEFGSNDPTHPTYSSTRSKLLEHNDEDPDRAPRRLQGPQRLSLHDEILISPRNDTEEMIHNVLIEQQRSLERTSAWTMSIDNTVTSLLNLPVNEISSAAFPVMQPNTRSLPRARPSHIWQPPWLMPSYSGYERDCEKASRLYQTYLTIVDMTRVCEDETARNYLGRHLSFIRPRLIRHPIYSWQILQVERIAHLNLM